MPPRMATTGRVCIVTAPKIFDVGDSNHEGEDLITIFEEDLWKAFRIR